MTEPHSTRSEPPARPPGLVAAAVYKLQNEITAAWAEAAWLGEEVERLRAGIQRARGLCSDEASLMDIDVFLGSLLYGQEDDDA